MSSNLTYHLPYSSTSTAISVTNPSLTSPAVSTLSHKWPNPSTSSKSPKRAKVSDPKKTTKKSTDILNNPLPPLSKSKYYLTLSSTPSASDADKSITHTKKQHKVPSHRDSDTQGGNHSDVSLVSGNIETYLSFSMDISNVLSLILSTGSLDVPLTSCEKHTRLQAMIEQKEKADAEPKLQLAKEEKKAKHDAAIRARALAEIEAKKQAEREVVAKKKVKHEVAAKTSTASSSLSGFQIDLPGLD